MPDSLTAVSGMEHFSIIVLWAKLMLPPVDKLNLAIESTGNSV